MASALVLAVCLLSVWINNGYVQARRFYNVGVTYEVVCNVYSGRMDPQWTVGPSHAYYNRVAYAVNQVPPSVMANGLGYCGFTVRATNALGQSAWKTVGRHTNRMLETMLLSSCGHNDISRRVMRHIRSGIIGQMMRRQRRPSKRIIFPKGESNLEIEGGDRIHISQVVRIKNRKKRQAGGQCSTRFDPANWNYGTVQRRNNCYNYACATRTDTFAQPGRGSGQRYTRTNVPNVYAAALRDGLQSVTSDQAGGCIVALVIWPGEDFHFLRKDNANNGLWSQKSGRTRARNTDDSGRLIPDPRFADRGPYRAFGGYLRVVPGITIR